MSVRSLSSPHRLRNLSDAMQRFGQKLRQLRTYHRMTLTALAQALGHSAHGYISEIESGKKMPTAEFVLNVARLFQVTTDELMKDELDVQLRVEADENGV
jgi:transcriptional regulator with XRE-family HTH domain